MKLANRTTHIAPSLTLSITAKAKSLKAQGIDVIDFSAGEPASDTPEYIKRAAEQAIQEGFTRYTPVSGTEDLKEAIIQKFREDQGLSYEKGQILVSCGAKHSLYNIAQALFESGDEVIIPAPYWVSYPDIVRLTDATPVVLHTEESTHYAIDPDALRSSISPRTKAIILNSPCNPTGAIYTRQTFESIADIALQHNLLIISDEIYEKMLYDGMEHVSIATLSPELMKNTIVVNGVSKAFSMTGWRIGYAAGPQEIISAMTIIQSQSTSNPTSISQKAAAAALQGASQVYPAIVKDLTPKRNLMVKLANSIEGMHCPTPSGAFYAFPNVSSLLGRKSSKGVIQSPADLAAYLLDEAQVACVPGEPFGSTSHIRFSYTPALETIQRGMERIKNAIQSLT
jgi:aspartate aminotransferase